VRVDYFGEGVAARYDEDDPGMFAPEVIAPTVDFLAALATEGAAGSGGAPQAPSALELGIGTGRVALPLSQRGVLVHGIDLSAAMVARLRAKPGADRVTAIIGDFVTATAGRAFRLVYLVYNTINNVTSQDDQVECFRNAAAHLEPGPGHGLPPLLGKGWAVAELVGSVSLCVAG
jgi:SAM-dependent methyltransferase